MPFGQKRRIYDDGAGPSTPYGGAHINGQTPQTPWTPGVPGPDTPWIGDDPTINKWYHHYQKPGRKGHPYSLEASAMQSAGTKRFCQDVRFFPWVGVWRPNRTAADVDWDDWEDVVAISIVDLDYDAEEEPGVQTPCILIGRITDEKPWTLLWTYEIKDDQIFRVAWSYDQFTLHPLILCCGMQGLVYIIDAVTQSLVKVWSGHGDEIIGIDVCQAMPHIVATTSTDYTIRLWNIHGTSAPDIPKIEKSENYPMADADEGTECIAVLGGQVYGHRERVVHCAFHPNHAALATCGADRAVKIWALPKLPMPKRETVTPKGYRPQLIPHPIFSTSRIHTDIVDWIDWIDSDVLASRDPSEMIVWHWTGYKRFFHPYSFDPMSRFAQESDMLDSHSFTVVMKYPIPKADSHRQWYLRPGVHRAFHPEDSERPTIRDYPHLVTSCLIAMPVEAAAPTIYMFNPSLVEPDSPPPVLKLLRPLEEDENYEDMPPSDEEEFGVGQGLIDHLNPSTERLEVDLPENGQQTSTVQIDEIVSFQVGNGDVDHDGLSTGDGTISSVERVKLRPRQSALSGAAEAPSPSKIVKSKEPKEAASKYKNPSTAPWVISVNPKTWKNIKRSNTVAKNQRLDKHFFQGVAISPRGAKWIVAVGDCEGVFVFKQKE